MGALEQVFHAWLEPPESCDPRDGLGDAPVTNTCSGETFSVSFLCGLGLAQEGLWENRDLMSILLTEPTTVEAGCQRQWTQLS